MHLEVFFTQLSGYMCALSKGSVGHIDASGTHINVTKYGDIHIFASQASERTQAIHASCIRMLPPKVHIYLGLRPSLGSVVALSRLVVQYTVFHPDYDLRIT